MSLSPSNMAIDLKNGKLIIGSCEDFEVPIRVEARKNPHVRRLVRARQAHTIMPGEVAAVPPHGASTVLRRASFLMTGISYLNQVALTT